MGVSHKEYKPVQDQVELDQQENQESQAQLRRWANTFKLQKMCSIWWKDDQQSEERGNHDSPHARHPGISNMYKIIKKDFWWPNMKQDIKQYIKGCAACQANKVNTKPLKLAMTPIMSQHHLPVQTVAMGFITNLPQSG